MRAGQVAITGCLFISNFAHEGGAIYVRSPQHTSIFSSLRLLLGTAVFLGLGSSTFEGRIMYESITVFPLNIQ